MGNIVEGTCTALVTPFRNGTLDEKALAELVEKQIEGGVEGLVPCGTTGESPTLSHEEHRRVVEVVVKQTRRRVPVIAGSGSASTQKAIEYCKLAKELGTDGVLLVTPYYNKPTQRGLEAHFRAIFKEVSIPGILYNIPGRTGIDLALETLDSLSDIKDIVAIKEATGNVTRSAQIVAKFGSRFAVFSGDDILTLPIMAVGGQGVISVTSNLLPREVSEVPRLWKRGEVKGAKDAHLRLLPVHEAMFVETNPGPIKSAVASRGWIAKEIRLPLVWPEPRTEDGLQKVLAEYARAT